MDLFEEMELLVPIVVASFLQWTSVLANTRIRRKRLCIYT